MQQKTDVKHKFVYKKGLYAAYVKTIKEENKATGKNKQLLSSKDFDRVLKSYFGHVMNGLIFDADTYTMPGRMGTIQLQQKPVNLDKLMIDWGATRKMWAKKGVNEGHVYHLNEHSNGKVIKTHWSKKRCTVTNKSLYSMELVRPKKRYLAKMIKANPHLVFVNTQ